MVAGEVEMADGRQFGARTGDTDAPRFSAARIFALPHFVFPIPVYPVPTAPVGVLPIPVPEDTLPGGFVIIDLAPPESGANPFKTQVKYVCLQPPPSA